LPCRFRSCVSVFGLPQVVNVQQRGMATQQQLKRRMRAVNNIKKITKAMKMVAAAKLRSVQSQLEAVRTFQEAITNVWPQPKEKDNVLDQIEGDKKSAVVCISADRGLCGSVNSTVSKQARVILKEANAKNQHVALITLGEKAKGALERVYKRNFALSVSEVYRAKVMPFKQVAMISDLLLQQNFDRMEFIYNRFKNVVSFITTRDAIYSLRALTPFTRSQFSKYTLESGGYDMTIIRSLYEFRFAVRLYHMFQEAATSEQSSRMTAMDNSSKNAVEMIGMLTLLYNRARQAKITTELCEIISGAESLKQGQAMML